MTIKDVENKIKEKVSTYENELDEEFKTLILGYIKIFNSVYATQQSRIDELQKNDNSNKTTATQLTEIALKHKESKEYVLLNYNFFMKNMPEKVPNIDEIEFKLNNE